MRSSSLLSNENDLRGLFIPKPTEWQHVGNQINSAMILARSDFAKVFNRCHFEDHQQHVPLFLRDRQGTSVPSSTRVRQRQLLKLCASFSLIRSHRTVYCKACKSLR